jgi:hypothetical protein
MLERMRRGYSREAYMELVALTKRLIPEVHCCYTVATLLLDSCCTVITLMLHNGHTTVILLSHCRYNAKGGAEH